MSDMESLYQQRLGRYVTALRNEKPDKIPIRPFLAEFTANVAGFTCQQVTHDYDMAYEAVIQTAKAYDFDALVVNMVWVWTGLSEAIGLDYYASPGIHIEPDVGFQYREPPVDKAFMRADEYDALIDDPTGYLLNVWLPRAAAPVCEMGQPVTPANNLSFLRGGMNMMAYFSSIGGQVQRMREEAGTVSAIAGILKAPLDIIADKLRGYLGLLEDLETQPKKVLAACEAIAPHLYAVALGSSDPTGTVPIGHWMHRSCVPFVNPETFNSIHWPTLKPIIQELWANGRQTMFYAEGSWDYHLDAFAELPDRSILYHVDQGDIMECHRKLGDKFCLSGGVPNAMLAYGTPDDVRAKCKEIIEGVAGNGGYIMDASAIVQNDAKPECIQAMVDTTREYGEYSSGSVTEVPELDYSNSVAGTLDNPEWTKSRVAPGVCVPFEEYKAGLPPISGDEALVKQIWANVDGMANMYAWQVLESF